MKITDITPLPVSRDTDSEAMSFLLVRIDRDRLWGLVGQDRGESVSAMLGQVDDTVDVYASSVFLEDDPASFHLELLEPLLSPACGC